MGPFSCEIFTKDSPFVVEVEEELCEQPTGECGDTSSDEWMTELESLQNEIDKISISTKISDEDFMIRVLNNLTEEYDVVLGGMAGEQIDAKRK